MTYIMQKYDSTPTKTSVAGVAHRSTTTMTRQVIYEAARNEFAAGGYAATSIEAVARRAGVSTKTQYRLIPNKVALSKSMVSDRLCHYAVYPIASESNPALVAFRDWLVEEAGRT
jgi:AcrR family transcriptional regulator